MQIAYFVMHTYQQNNRTQSTNQSAQFSRIVINFTIFTPFGVTFRFGAGWHTCTHHRTSITRVGSKRNMGSIFISNSTQREDFSRKLHRNTNKTQNLSRNDGKLNYTAHNFRRPLLLHGLWIETRSDTTENRVRSNPSWRWCTPTGRQTTIACRGSSEHSPALLRGCHVWEIHAQS